MIARFMDYCHSKQLRPKTMSSYEQTLKLFARWLEQAKHICMVEKIKDKPPCVKRIYLVIGIHDLVYVLDGAYSYCLRTKYQQIKNSTLSFWAVKCICSLIGNWPMVRISQCMLGMKARNPPFCCIPTKTLFCGSVAFTIRPVYKTNEKETSCCRIKLRQEVICMAREYTKGNISRGSYKERIPLCSLMSSPV